MPSEIYEEGKTKYRLVAPLTATTIMTDTTCSLRLHMLKVPYTLTCGFQGPPMNHFLKAGDRVILREKEKHTALKGLTLQTEIKNSRRYWLCFFDLKCYVYRDLEDINPRFIINMRTADIEMSQAIPSAVCIVFSDNRTFILEFDNVSDARKFLFVYTESKELQCGTSAYSKTLPKERRPFGHEAFLI